MKKTGSTGDLFYNDQKYFMRNRLRPVTAARQTKFLRSSDFLSQNLNSIEVNSLTNNLSNCNCEHLLSNQTPKQLYDGLMSLKKRVNLLNEEISLAKSERRKKEVQLNTKNREIEEYLSDFKTSKYLNPKNVDKLKEMNAISKLKQEYKKLKKILEGLKYKIKILEKKLRKSRPNDVKQVNANLQNKLKTLIAEYTILHQNNTAMNIQLEEMKDLPMIFNENHKIIENLKKRIDIQEKNVEDLKNEIMMVNEKENYNKIILDRQKIKNINLNLKNNYLENAIESKKQIAEMKIKYNNKIKQLNEKKDELEDKYRNQERSIKSIKNEIKLFEKNKNPGYQFKLKTFNYKSISNIESNPLNAVGSKVILLQSLLHESLDKKINYQTLIQECINRFKELGYDYTKLDKIIEEGKDKELNEKNNNDNENQKSKEINENIKENNKINNNDLDNECNNIINEKENEEEREKEEDIDRISENLKGIGNNINKENQEILNVSENNNNNEDKDEKEKELKESNSKEFNEIKIINDDNQEDKREKEKIVTKESKESKNNKNNTELSNTPKSENLQKQKDNLTNPNNNNNKPSNISIKEKNEDKNSIIENEEFSDFTFILTKNFEAKKINEDLARQKIIIISTKEQMDQKTFIDQMSFNIMKSIHCENESSLEDTKKWLSSFLSMFDNDQKKVTENFLNLFQEVNIYNNEKELFFSKKIKKFLYIKNPNFAKKLEPYKNKYISFQTMKKFIEEENIELKEEYAQYLFYELKKYDDPQSSIYDLKTDNIFKIFENEQNDSKMDEESDIEISNEQYVNIIYNIGNQINKYLEENNKNLRQILGDKVKNISDDDIPDKDKIEIIVMHDLVEKLKEIGIELNSEIEIYCLFNRYKISEEYGVISFNLLEKDLENFKNNKIDETDIQNQNEINKEINNINELDRLDNIRDDVEISEKSNLKVMEKVQEENEDNASNSENK